MSSSGVGYARVLERQAVGWAVGKGGMPRLSFRNPTVLAAGQSDYQKRVTHLSHKVILVTCWVAHCESPCVCSRGIGKAGTGPCLRELVPAASHQIIGKNWLANQKWVRLKILTNMLGSIEQSREFFFCPVQISYW